MSDGLDARRATLRTAVKQLVAGIAVFDAIVLSIWYGAGMPRAAPDVRTRFAVVWMILTALLVAFLLRRVRRARLTPMR